MLGIVLSSHLVQSKERRTRPCLHRSYRANELACVNKKQMYCIHCQHNQMKIGTRIVKMAAVFAVK